MSSSSTARDNQVSGNNANDQYAVFNWLSHMKTDRPLVEGWLSPGDGNHVQELYQGQAADQSNTPALWVWITITLSLALICMFIVVLIGIDKCCCKWDPYQGTDCNLWTMMRNCVMTLWKKMSNKRFKDDTNEICDPYEKPVNIELEEIIVYQEGRRVTLETDEHAQLLEEARFSESNSPFSPRSVTNANNTNNKRYNKKTTTTTITTTSAITTPDTTSTPISFRNNTTTNTNIFNFNSPENQQQKETMKSPSLKAKMALKRIRCLATRTVSINSPTTTDNYEKNTSKNVSSSKRGASATEDFQTRPLPPLPISPEFQNHHHRQNQYHPQDSPFRMHSLFNTSLDASFHSSSNTSTSKLKYQELEDYLQKNSSHPDLLSCSVDFTSKRKNTLSEFRKHRSTYNNKNRRKYVATELQKLHENNRIGNLLARQRSNSIDERFSEASLKRKRKQTRRSRSMDDLLDNVTVNQLYVDIKSVTMATTAYEEVPENLKQHRHQEQQKQRPKKPPRLFYESYHSHCNQQRQQEMWSPRDGGLTVSTNTLIGGENEYARITDLPPPSLSSSTLLEGAPDLSHKQVNIQQRPMPPTPTLLDMCFMKQNPANNTYTAPTTTALSSPQQKQRHATTAQQQTVHESEGMSEETASSIVISNMVALTGGDSKLNSDDAFVNVNDNRASTFIKAGHYKKPKPAVTSPLSLSKIPTVGGLGCPPHISPLAASRSSEDINEHNYSIRERRHLSAHFPSFRSSMSGSSGTYAKIPDLLIADLPGGGWTP